MSSDYLGDEDIVVTTRCRTLTTKEASRCGRSTDHHNGRIDLLNGVIGCNQHLGVIAAIDLTLRPFAVDVGFVPDFQCVGIEQG